ncbi:MAG: UDP-galactopyranose mutase [Defluviitaleaceae bacterium]|nr:UDP-galactopyranose mutase [Defluviitaleaceae bacterium]MCL2239568.1 UDP-galactopyranose mutase [Defluviitaleaceae bacterium]
MSYDYLIVGAGLFGSVFAREAVKKGKKCLVVDKRSHIGGNCYTENMEGIQVHKYGAHIFRTSEKHIWEYMNQFVEFNRFTNSPIANYNGKIYSLPFNMNTFYQLWGTITPDEARARIESQREGIVGPKNLEEQAIFLVGTDVYNILIKEYTEKQWGRKCVDLPASIIRRLPVRFTYDNNYFNDRYQGIPIGGYTQIFEKMLDGCDVRLGTAYTPEMATLADAIIYTGTIDGYYNYQFGALEYRSLRFAHEILDTNNFQGNAVVNYTSAKEAYTRIIEHKHFEFGTQDKTVITKEYPQNWTPADEPYYPINDDKNASRYEKYLSLARKERNVHFKGRLGGYQYLDMQDVINMALNFAKEEL